MIEDLLNQIHNSKYFNKIRIPNKETNLTNLLNVCGNDGTDFYNLSKKCLSKIPKEYKYNTETFNIMYKRFIKNYFLYVSPKLPYIREEQTDAEKLKDIAFYLEAFIKIYDIMKTTNYKELLKNKTAQHDELIYDLLSNWYFIDV